MNSMEIAMQHVHTLDHSFNHSPQPWYDHVPRPCNITTRSPCFPSMHHHHKLTTFPIHAPSPQDHHVSHPCSITTSSTLFPSMHHHHKIKHFSHPCTISTRSPHFLCPCTTESPPQPSCFPASFVPQNIQGHFKFPSILILVHSHKWVRTENHDHRRGSCSCVSNPQPLHSYFFWKSSCCSGSNPMPINFCYYRSLMLHYPFFWRICAGSPQLLQSCKEWAAATPPGLPGRNEL
jgi:hypothetical protein